MLVYNTRKHNETNCFMKEIKMNIGIQINELCNLRDGWLNGAGESPKAEGLYWLTIWLKNNFPPDLSLPYLYPTHDGGVQAEWSINGYEVSIDVDIDNHSAVWHALDMNADNDKERVLDMNSADDSKWIIDQLRQMQRRKK